MVLINLLHFRENNPANNVCLDTHYQQYIKLWADQHPDLAKALGLMFNFQLASSSIEVKFIVTLRGISLNSLLDKYKGLISVKFKFLKIPIQVSNIFLNIGLKHLLSIKKDFFFLVLVS